jgi:hypothetical protein
MKRILFLLAVLIYNQGFAQDPNPDLFQTWHLYEIEFENGPSIIVANYDPPIAPTLLIEPTLTFNGIGACNTFEGIFTYFPPNGFEVASETNTTASCGFDENMFENEYFGFFFEGTYMISTIETDTDGFQTLYMSGDVFTTFTFRNTPVLATPKFSKTKMSLYPNPTFDELNIISNNLEINNKTIYSLQGKAVFSENSNSKTIDVSNLSEGFYFIEISSSDGKSIQKFIKH